MLEAIIRPYFQKICVDPVVACCRSPLITPNRVTLLGVLLGMAAGVAIANYAVLAVVLLLLSGLCDSVDGSLARVKGMSSELGSVFDIVSDRVVEAAVMLGLFAYAPLVRGWWVLAMLSAMFLCVTAFLVVSLFLEKSSDKSFSYSPGFIERPEAFGFFIVMILFPGAFSIVAAVFAALVLLTCVQHIHGFIRYKKGQ
jgi:archaetidylinositol phosphate synthase